MVVDENGMSGLVSSVLSSLLEQKTMQSRNGPCKEMTGVTLSYPSNSSMSISVVRKDYFLAKIFETAWMLSGEDRINQLSKFIPRAVDFSDDGLTWSGAYGRRMRHKPDQLLHCMNLLRRDPESRRAVIGLYDPMKDIRPTKDVPCNNMLQFLIRDGAMNLHVSQRSCDFWWGFTGINAYEWCNLLKTMARAVEVKPGVVVHHFGSLHLYEPHWKKALSWVGEIREGGFPFSPELVKKVDPEVAQQAINLMESAFIDLVFQPDLEYTHYAMVCNALYSRACHPGSRLDYWMSNVPSWMLTNEYALIEAFLQRCFTFWDKRGPQPYTHECFRIAYDLLLERGNE